MLNTLPDTHWGPINLCPGNHKGWKDEKWSWMLKVCFVHRNQKTWSPSSDSFPALNTVTSFPVTFEWMELAEGIFLCEGSVVDFLFYFIFFFSFKAISNSFTEIQCGDFKHGPYHMPRWLSSKESACQCRRLRKWGFDPWVGKMPWRRKWQPTPVFLPGKSHRQRSLVGIVHGVSMSWTWLSTQHKTHLTCITSFCTNGTMKIFSSRSELFLKYFKNLKTIGVMRPGSVTKLSLYQEALFRGLGISNFWFWFIPQP